MKTYLLLIAIVCCSTIHAQRLPVLNQVWNCYSFMNPATSGLEYKHQAAVLYRNQWDGVNGAPNTIMGNYNYEINRKHAVGINYMNETIGASRINGGVLNYNYRIHFSDSIQHLLSIGAGIGVSNYYIDYTKLYAGNLNVVDLAYSHSSTTYAVLNVGVAYRYKRLFLGLGSNQLTESLLAQSNTSYTYRAARGYSFIAAYDFRIAEQFSLKPQLLVRADAIKAHVQLNLLATIYKNYSVGFFYRGNDAIGFNAQVDLFGKYRIGYGYEYTTSKLAGISKGSHEIVLGFQLK